MSLWDQLRYRQKGALLLDQYEREYQETTNDVWELYDCREVDDLIFNLDSENRHFRQAAVQALGQLRDKRAIDPLIIVLKKDPDRWIRWITAEALGDLGDKKAVEPLTDILENTTDGLMRQAAVEALGKLGNTANNEQFIAILKNDQNRWVRWITTEALGQLGDKSAVENLISNLESDNEWFLVRQSAAVSLGYLRDTRAIQSLIGILGDRNNSVRLAATTALIQIGSPVIEPLIAALDDRNSNVRQAAIEALGQIGDRNAIEPLISKLGDGNDNVRSAAAIALKKMGQKIIVNAVLAALEGRHHGLIHIKDNLLVVSPLCVALESGDSKIRRRAAEGLGILGNPQSINSLISILGDRNSNVRQAAVSALVQIGAPAAQPLITALENRDSVVRQAASSALGQLSDRRAVKPLIETLRDMNTAVRRSAAAALGKLKDVRAIEPLCEVYHRKDSVHRIAKLAIKAICKQNKRNLSAHWHHLICIEHLTRFTLHRVPLWAFPRPTYYACRICKNTDTRLEQVSQVIVVLDTGMMKGKEIAGDKLRVNWMKRKSLFDFDRVEIVQATDEDVERFAIQVGNDTDDYRQERYPKMRCVVSCELSENTIRILSSLFGQVDTVFEGGKRS